MTALEKLASELQTALRSFSARAAAADWKSDVSTFEGEIEVLRKHFADIMSRLEKAMWRSGISRRDATQFLAGQRAEFERLIKVELARVAENRSKQDFMDAELLEIFT